MNEDTRSKLLAAGWTPDRRIDTAPAIEKLRQFGYPILSSQIDFLAEFGDLTIPLELGRLYFDVPELLGGLVRMCAVERLDRCWCMPGEEISIIGIFREYTDEHPVQGPGDRVLMITASGHVFSRTEDLEFMEGETVDEALDNLYKNEWLYYVFIGDDSREYYPGKGD